MKPTFQLLILFAVMIITLNGTAAVKSSSNCFDGQQGKLTVSAVQVTQIKATQAKCSFTVQGSPISEKGVCYSDGPSPTINSKKSLAPGNPTNTGISMLSGLKANTTYYVRAYAKSGSEVYYGSERSFTTAAADEPSKTSGNFGQKVESKPTNSK
jgi:hypothetical protein